MRIFTSKAIITIASALILCGCTPTHTVRGNFVDQEDIQNVKIGSMTKNDVTKVLGSPTSISTFDDNIWYYLGQHTKKVGIFDPTITDELIVTVEFDDKGLVNKITTSQGDRIEVPYSKDSTPTYGNELTVMQNLLGNLGRFNPTQE